jgi:hypothetical protein
MTKRAATTAPPALDTISFRAFLESPRFCGLALSPIAAAIADAADGARVTSINDATCARIFGVRRADLPTTRPSIVTVIAGGQGGKTTRLGAPKALHAAWTVPVPTSAGNAQMGAARSLIIAPDTDLASADFEACKGYVWGSPVLRDAMRRGMSADRSRRVDWDADEYGGPSRHIPLRRPDGTKVEVIVRAGLKRGTSARSRPLVCLLLDEVCFFETDAAAVTDKDILDAALQRLAGQPGAQAWLVSTPWEETIGEAMRFVAERDAQPDPKLKHRRALVVGGSEKHNVSTIDLRPDWSGDLDEIKRDLARYSREFLGIPLAAGSSRWFDLTAIDICAVRPVPSGQVEGVGLGADFGFERDHSAQAATERFDGEVYDCAGIQEQAPRAGAPLKTSVVCKSAALFALAHGSAEVMADIHYRVSVQEELEREKVRFVDAPGGESGKWDMFSFARDVMAEARLGLSRLPAATLERLKSNLLRVMKKPRAGGRMEIYVPRRKGQGHADDVTALVTSLWHARTGVGVGRATKLAALNASMPHWSADGHQEGEEEAA